MKPEGSPPARGRSWRSWPSPGDGLRCCRAGLDSGPWYGVDDATGGGNGTPIAPCRASGRESRRPSGDVAVLRTPPVDPAPPRRLSGYRAYPVETVERVRLIKWAQGLGFSLREIGELARIPRDHVHGRARDVRARASSKIHEIDERIGRLRAMRRQLRAIVRCRCNGNCPIVARALSEGSQQ